MCLVDYNWSASETDITFTVWPERGTIGTRSLSSHPAPELPRMLLFIGGAGLHIKQNTRVQTTVIAD